MESAISGRGQATIPKAHRERLGLTPGDRVKLLVHPDGTVVLLPKRPISALRGIVGGDLALASARLPDGSVTAEIARRQADGTWLWVVDQFAIS